MTFRTSIKLLEEVCRRINVATGSPTEYSDRTSDKFKANIGYHHVYASNGGYCLHITCNEGGGVHAKFHSNTKNKLIGKLNAFLDGLHQSRFGE